MALPKRHRITRGSDFDKVFSKGETVKNSFFFVYYLKNNRDYVRIKAIVSSKVSNKAVKRNTIRRKLEEIVKSHLLKLKPGFDIIIISRHKVKEQEYPKLKESLEEIFLKANLVK